MKRQIDAARPDAWPEVQTGAQLGVYGCDTCGRVSQLAGPAQARSALRRLSLHCPRCGTSLRHCRSHSLEYTWACLIAAMLLYVPANTLPIMSTSSVFGLSQHTILGGIGELWSGGDWVLALIVFVASIVVPIGKISTLLLLALTAQRKSRWCSRERTQLYRLVEAVGHWSMLDVFVVVLVVGMIRFGGFAGVQPEPGLLAFGTVVVLTMLATSSFDTRLLWPEASQQRQAHD
ncbi:MAG TPA: paraquat-inducible protein A [Rhizobacter sp.]|nr:paraquat-inducible protein A [Rhizobacter sp.]